MANDEPITTMVEKVEEIETPDSLTIEEQVELAAPTSFVPSDGGPVELIEQEDGGVIVDFDPSALEVDESDFFCLEFSLRKTAAWLALLNSVEQPTQEKLWLDADEEARRNATQSEQYAIQITAEEKATDEIFKGEERRKRQLTLVFI